jgi:bifunctional non-homologous end joining protein LigD
VQARHCVYTFPVPIPQFQPMLLGRKVEHFNDSECLFELKYDGFRALAIILDSECTLVSRNGNAFRSFEGLRLGLPTDLNVRTAVLDGEIACLDSTGRSVFDDLLYRRREPVLVAFDVLSIDCDDLRCSPLFERKRELRRVLKSRPLRSLYCSHRGNWDSIIQSRL